MKASESYSRDMDLCAGFSGGLSRGTCLGAGLTAAAQLRHSTSRRAFSARLACARVNIRHTLSVEADGEFSSGRSAQVQSYGQVKANQPRTLGADISEIGGEDD